MRTSILFAFILALASHTAGAAIKVVTATPELASIARSVGGSNVSVVSLARPEQDYHKVEARPSDVTRVASASLLVRLGMDLDLWVDALTNAARNRRVARGGQGHVDASAMIRKLEVPTGQITGASGDIHTMGNPHYWLDPANGKVIAYQILLGLRRVDPENAAEYDARYKRFAADLDRRIKGWTATLAPAKGCPVVAYHAEWVYFYSRFGLKAFGYLEPKPGIPPSAGHISSLMARMKASRVQILIVPSIYPMRYPELVAKQTAARIVRVPYSVGSMGTSDYAGYMDAIVSAVARGLR